jgi:Tripartite ATP-independent periplasmic transporters, DctQ component
VKRDAAAALEAGFGSLIEGLALLASLALLAMVAIICADVLTRNVALPGMPSGVAWSNEVSELLLYAITLLAAPWLLREGRHIRVDIVLRAVPARAAYACEWIADVPLAGRLRRLGGVAEPAERGALDQDAGDARVVVPRAAAGLLRAARDRVRLSHAPPALRRGRTARRRGERSMKAGS